jgi:hypothetical protein
MRKLNAPGRRRRISVRCCLLASSIFTALGLFILTLRSIDPSTDIVLPIDSNRQVEQAIDPNLNSDNEICATVEEMGSIFQAGTWEDESLRVRNHIQRHFDLQGASRVRNLAPSQFCRHGFVLAKASEAGLGNEMYKILTAGALSIMLNRSLIIGQTRHIGYLSSLAIHICILFQLDVYTTFSNDI